MIFGKSSWVGLSAYTNRQIAEMRKMLQKDTIRKTKNALPNGDDGVPSFDYVADNRLRSISCGGVITNYLCDDDDLVVKYDGEFSLLRGYIPRPGVDEPLLWYEGTTLGDQRLFAADNQGSIIAVSNPAGLVFNRFAYGDHGEPSQQTGSAFIYTSQRIIPGTGLYHYKARAIQILPGHSKIENTVS